MPDLREMLAEAVLANTKANLANAKVMMELANTLTPAEPADVNPTSPAPGEDGAYRDVAGELISRDYSKRVIEFATLAESLSPEALDKMFDLVHGLVDEEMRKASKTALQDEKERETAEKELGKAALSATVENPKRFRGNVTAEKVLKFVGQFEEFYEDTARKTVALLNDVGFRDFVAGYGVEVKLGADGGILKPSVRAIVALEGFGTPGWYPGLGGRRAALLRAIAE